MKDIKHNNYQENRPHRDHRNQDARWHNAHRQKRNSFFRAGQIFSTIYHLTSFGLIYLLVQEGKTELASRVLLINAGLVVFALLLATIERKFNSSRHSRSGRGTRNNRTQHRRPNSKFSDR